MLLGLKRDDNAQSPETSSLGNTRVASPSEAVAVAQAMRLELYAECSAVTGRTLQQACDDIVTMALRTLESGGGRNDGPQCITM